jgi:hypothetical protein
MGVQTRNAELFLAVLIFSMIAGMQFATSRVKQQEVEAELMEEARASVNWIGRVTLEGQVYEIPPDFVVDIRCGNRDQPRIDFPQSGGEFKIRCHLPGSIILGGQSLQLVAGSLVQVDCNSARKWAVDMLQSHLFVVNCQAVRPSQHTIYFWRPDS